LVVAEALQPEGFILVWPFDLHAETACQIGSVAGVVEMAVGDEGFSTVTTLFSMTVRMRSMSLPGPPTAAAWSVRPR
jgi:hypothetical protein